MPKMPVRRLLERIRKQSLDRLLDRLLGMAAHAAEQRLDADARLAMPPRALSAEATLPAMRRSPH